MVRADRFIGSRIAQSENEKFLWWAEGMKFSNVQYDWGARALGNMDLLPGVCHCTGKQPGLEPPAEAYHTMQSALPEQSGGGALEWSVYGEAVPCEGDHLAQLSLQEVDSLAAGQSTEGGALPGQRDRFAALGIELEPLGKIEGRAVLLLKVEKAPVNGGNEVLTFRKGAGGENGGTHELRQQSV